MILSSHRRPVRENIEEEINSFEAVLDRRDRLIHDRPREECVPGFISLDEGSSAASSRPPVELEPDQPVAIFYTSGTTGFRKGAVMSSRNLLTSQKIAAAILPVGPRTKGLYCLPAAHVMGFGCIITGCCVGLEAYCMRHFEPRQILDAMKREGVNLSVGVPAMYASHLDRRARRGKGGLTILLHDGYDSCKYDSCKEEFLGTIPQLKRGG